MQTLFIDLASNPQALALVSNDNVLAIRHAAPRFEERDIMPIIESMPKAERIACVTGPGGFMSLRTGAALANALAYSLNIPLAGLHLSELWKTRMKATNNQSPVTINFLWLHSTKRTHLFIRGFGDFAKQWPEAILLENKVLADIPAGTPIVGELIDEHTALVTQCQRVTSLAPVEQVLPPLLAGLQYSQAQLVPWYGREA